MPEVKAVAERSYYRPEVRAAAERSYCTPEVRGNGQEELLHIQGQEGWP